MVKTRSATYSGFNMGAGENALFEIFSTILAWPEGTLIIVDELELGLHEEAQTRFIDELKKVCEDRHIQIICTTHSMNVLRSVPPEARFFIERIGDQTIVTPGISPAFAGGKLAGENSNELDIFVEDDRARTLVQSVLAQEVRLRVNILTIGSAAAVSRQLAARYKNIKKGECLGILDGDKSNKLSEHKTLFLRAVENPQDQVQAKEWIGKRLIGLPGNSWPERWLLKQCKETIDEQLAEQFSTSEESLLENIEKAVLARKHDEFYTLSRDLGYDEDDFVCQTLCRHVAMKNTDMFRDIRTRIVELLT